MSIFNPVTLTCPHCSREVVFQASASVNADRRPDLRSAILDDSFQREPCPNCGTAFRAEPQLNYLDVGRQQWIAAFPRSWLDRWEEIEPAATESFEKAFGSGAEGPAREIGRTLTPRMVFGWEGLREKLVAAEAGLNDADLELAKLALLRGMDDPPLPAGEELRLVEVAPAQDALVIVTVPRQGADERGEELRVPRGLYDDVVAEPDDWAALREQITQGLFVDALRLTRGA